MLLGKRRAPYIFGLAAGMVVCLLILQVHASLHVDAGLRPPGQRGPIHHSHGSTASDCQICASNHWIAPEFSPQLAGLHPGGWLESSPQPCRVPPNEFRQTAPRAPPQA